MEKEVKRLKLHGFNNLTKSLSFNMYDICYTKTVADREAYLQYIDEQYNADRLTEILTNVSNIIGANILNIAKQESLSSLPKAVCTALVLKITVPLRALYRKQF